MSIIKTDVIVLKSIKYGDTSKIVTLYSKDLGKVKAIIKGARNYKSGMSGIFQTLNFLSVIIYFKESREIQNLSKAEFITSFKNITEDFDKLQIALRVIEIINKSLPDMDPNPELFKIASVFFTGINNPDSDNKLLLLNFQIEFLKISGMYPDLKDVQKNFETLKNNTEFNLNDEDINFLLKLSDSKTSEETISNERSNYNVSKISDCFSSYIVNHNSTKIFFKTDKVFREINK
ncbi:MAG TPA: DNA repair protein RecO [Ignavibacteria bacterium]|nr:DNA repair protein RecO [Ignavibacteria bacterium]HQY50810.1 DNA repair protein RecO [Ignavibacteria bacterium]HRB00119.1 DNA repair protein RecO [Ignavibacteria bacterium]